MKRQISRFTMTIGFAAMFGSALLTAETLKGTVEVPFDFQLKNRTLPAGTYTVSRSIPDSFVIIRNEGTHESIMALAPPLHESTGEVSKLVFQCYDERCFLSTIWLAGDSYGRGVGQSREEKELARGKIGVLAAIRFK